MKTIHTLPILKSLLILVAASVLLSCTNSKNLGTAMILKDVESYMNDRPDSALTVLQRIGNKSLTSKELKARHALLLSQALDKNVIDLQSDSIIAPAVRYFETTDDYEALFKAYYYHGRVLANADKNIEAMQTYLKAEDISDKVSDIFAVGLLHAQIGRMYAHYFNYAKAAEYVNFFSIYLDFTPPH